MKSRAERWFAALMLAWAMGIPPLGAMVAWATAARWRPLLDGSDAAALWLGLATAAATGLSLVPSHVAALVCGYVLGAGTGALVAWLAIGAAAVLGYGIARPLVTARAERWIAGHQKAARVHAALVAQARERRIGLVTLLRLSPLMPFALTNFLMAAARVPFVDFQIGSWLGMTPRVLAVAVAGAGLADLVDARTSSPWLLALGIAATLAAVTWIGRIARRALETAGGL